jgi:CHAT domain-containing protein
MSTLKIKIEGTKVPDSSKDSTAHLKIEQTIKVGTATRADGLSTSVHDVELNDRKFVEFTFEDGTVWFGDHTTLEEMFAGVRQQEDKRSIDGIKEIVLPNELYIDDQKRDGMFSKVMLKVVKIFTKELAATTVSALATKVENTELGKDRGLCNVSDKFVITKANNLPDGHYFLFLHGTASSTTGAFKTLEGSAAWKYIHEKFPNRVIALEHESLTKSPLENVRELLDQLPQKATLTMMSHSRGGLIGDILDRFCIKGITPRGFSDKEKNYLRKHKRFDDLKIIDEIEKTIIGKDITVDRFIRVACTASGTTLASRRLDIYLSVLVNLFGLSIGQTDNPAFQAFRELIAALIETKDDASVLPGVEVQNPRSPFNQVLNNANPATIITSPLMIISGDAKLSFEWSALKVFLSNMFFWGDNDFVVDTRSMYNGARRKDNSVQYFFHQDASVGHSKYFINEKTRYAIEQALKSPGDSLIPSFSRLNTRRFTEQEIRSTQSGLKDVVSEDRVSGKRPIVVLVPGIFGSALSVNNAPVWLNFSAIAEGGIIDLAYNKDNNTVKVDGLLSSPYRKLTEYLKRDYDVITFGFDWRIPTAENVSILRRKLEVLQDYGQPVKIIAHSTGGLLIRDLIIDHRDAWDRLKSSPGFRVIFLGTPFMGSFRIPYMLMGKDELLGTLDLVDLNNSQKELSLLFSGFPGLLNLLPLTKGENDFANPETWDKMSTALGEEKFLFPVHSVSREHLRDFDAYRDKIEKAMLTIEDYGPATYIAGKARQNRQTICDCEFIEETGEDAKLEFHATKEGDEWTTWDCGIPLPKEDVYYSDVSHGELANDPQLFGVITDILHSGSTSLLKGGPRSVRNLDKNFKAKEVFDFDLSADGVEKTLLGLGSANTFSSAKVPISVSIGNGNLKFASFPLMVGHFENDGIISAEKALDSHLEGELDRRHRLGLYPGPVGTSEIILSGKSKKLQGAIIVGLGRQGLLTEFILTNTIEQGVAKYLAYLNSRPNRAGNQDLKTQRTAISTLLIGSGYGGLRIENAVRAILQGVQNANEKIRHNYQDSPRIIESVQFIELYKDRALACAKVIGALEKDESRSLNILLSEKKITPLAGLRERLPIDDTTEWWTRITVRAPEKHDKVWTPQNGLQFTISTDAARLEERWLTTIDQTVAGMLMEMSHNDEWSADLAKSIFELMIPNDFKDQVKRQSNINWILDDQTAAYPWELLQDGHANAQPLSVNSGMMRQLATKEYRINVNPVMARKAIVIGDPNLNNDAIQLPKAKEEGEKIAELLRVQGYEVNELVSKSASQILRNLFGKDYKIMHLAGHGVYSADPEKQTGMLIGPDAYLTPNHIDQMSSVPDLVFVNCCYLGEVSLPGLSQEPSHFAANIGTKLIRMGVKAVVVAGWAVNDKAAHDFAESFYEAMFTGATFGNAVKKARKKIFETYGQRNNTWGAYQCYGDPFYQLAPDRSSWKPVYEFIISEEAEIELSNLLNRVGKGGYDREEVIQTMEAINKAVVKGNLKSGRITELRAYLFSAVYQYKEAVKEFEELMKQEKASFSFSATEKFCNTSVKWQALQVKESSGDAKVIQEAEESICKSIKRLEALQAFGETVERMNLLGSAYKRLATVRRLKKKQNAYEQSAIYYKNAYEVGKSARHYPLTNWLTINYCLDLVKPEQEKGHDLLTEHAEKLKAEFQSIEKGVPGLEYWDWIANASLLLCQRVLGDQNITYDQVLEQYIAAWEMIGSEGQRQSEIEQLDFLNDALTMAGPKAAETLEFVKRLKMALELLA